MSSLVTNKEHNKASLWNNSFNIDLYETMPPDYLQKIAIKSGLDNGCDLNYLHDMILQTKNILEIGAGYGRVIKNLFKMNYKGNITAIERSQLGFDYLQEQYKDYSNVKLICADIKKHQTDKNFDLILWLWSGIAEFSFEEQASVIASCFEKLSTNGRLIIDIAASNPGNTNSLCIKGQNHLLQTQFGNAYGYLTTPIELRQMCLTYHLSIEKQFSYLSETKQKRNLCILIKK